MKQHIHFIGIGGIGMSALARYYAAKGYMISGSDQASSDLTTELRTEGMHIAKGHAEKNIPRNAEKIIYSAAVRENNSEMKEARSRGIPVFSYAEALGDLTKQYITIAVSGAHGKSTTTALLSLIMIRAGLDPTVVIGTRLAEFNGKNMRLGHSRYLVIEADEWNRSFLHYSPAIAVITNIDKEHLDTYGNLHGVIETFKTYLRGLPREARAILNAGDINSMRAAKACACHITPYNKKVLARWPLKIPGDFNQINAEAAWTAARELGITKKIAREAMRAYQGSWRRMEPLEPHRFSIAEKLRGTFFSDYAHHPNEIKATLQALREKYPRRKLLVIFQAHQRERLTNLFNDFIHAFENAHHVALLPTYEVAGREQNGGKTSDHLAHALRAVRKEKNKKRKTVFNLKNFKEALTLIKGQVVVFMGAGSIDADARKYFKSKLIVS